MPCVALPRENRKPNEAGTTAIEFAIVAPVLLLLISVWVETGAFLLLQNQLQAATDAAARQIRVGRVGPLPTSGTSTPQMSSSDFKNEICKKFSVTSCQTLINIDVRRGSSFAAIKTIMPNPRENVGQTLLGGPSYAETYDPGGPGEMGSLIVTYDWKFVMPGMTALFGNVADYPGIRRLAAHSIYRNEM